MSDENLVFIVDDDEGFVDTIEMFLKRKGYQIVIAKNVEQASAKLDQIQPALAIVDLLLDDGEGTQVVKKIKSKNPATYTIILSGHREDKASKKAAACGADQFISKPFTTSQLKEVLDQKLSR